MTKQYDIRLLLLFLSTAETEFFLRASVLFLELIIVIFKRNLFAAIKTKTFPVLDCHKSLQYNANGLYRTREQNIKGK